MTNGPTDSVITAKDGMVRLAIGAVGLFTERREGGRGRERTPNCNLRGGEDITRKRPENYEQRRARVNERRGNRKGDSGNAQRLYKRRGQGTLGLN